MAMNDFNIGFIGSLDGTKSKNKINQDIDSIKKSLKELELKVKINPNQIKAIESQLNTLKVNLSNVSFDQAALNKLVSQINNSLSGIKLQIPNLNTGNIDNQAKQIGNNIGQQITQSINSAIQKGSMLSLKEFKFDGKLLQNDVAKKALEDFKTLGQGIVTVKEEMKNIDGKNLLNGFTINIKNAKGEVESLRYALKDIEGKTGQSFQYVGGSINDNGVIKQMNTISAKADSLQTKLEKIKSNYSDINAPRPIKDSNNISALEQQYNKISQAIENVRNADNATFSSMTSNAQREITVLENMVSQFRNAENVATQMKSVDISSGIAQAQERLGKLKANSSGFEQMTQTIHELDIAIEGVGDKASLDKFINDLRVAESQLGRVKAESKQLSEVNKIQLSMGDGTYESKVESLIARTQQWTDANGNARISTNELSKAFDQLTTASNNYTNSPTEANQKVLIASEKELDKQIKTVTNSVRSMNAELAKDSAISSFRNQVADFMSKNGKTVKSFQFGSELKDIFAQIAQGSKLSNQELAVLKQRFIDVQNAARTAGKLGKTWFQTLREGMSSFSYWTSSTFLVMKAIQSVKGGIRSIVELDTALVDLKKTATMTNSELEKFYYDSNKTAKQMGVTTKEILEQASAWSRLGFSTAEQATKMAKYSSMFKLISPGMDLESSTDGLVSVMKAFKIGLEDTDDVVDGIMSKINIIGNTKALNNSDIIEFLTRSSSAMASANNSLEETIALGEAAVEVTRDASNTGQVMKTTSMRIRGYDEEFESYTEDLENLKGEIADLTKTAKTPGGISLFTDETKETYKSTYKILEEISEIWNDLTDKNQANSMCLYVQKCA